jgi:hypothetical protein
VVVVFWWPFRVFSKGGELGFPIFINPVLSSTHESSLHTGWRPVLKWLTSERAQTPLTMVSVSNGRPVWAVPGTPELTGASYAFAKAFVNATTFPLPIQRATWGELELVRQRASRDQVCVLLTQGATKRC